MYVSFSVTIVLQFFVMEFLMLICFSWPFLLLISCNIKYDDFFLGCRFLSFDLRFKTQQNI